MKRACVYLQSRIWIFQDLIFPYYTYIFFSNIPRIFPHPFNAIIISVLVVIVNIFIKKNCKRTTQQSVYFIQNTL